MLIRRIARPMLASVFVVSGVDTLRNPGPRGQMAQGFVDKSVEILPNEVTNNVPTDPTTLVRINGAVQVGGGVLLALGKFPRVASLGLAGSLVPTTLAGHAFWEETDPAKKAAQRTQFLKNVSLLGGLLIASVDTEGKPSLAWRGRRKADAASAAVAAAIPFGAKAGASTWDSLLEKTHEGTHVIAERSTDIADKISERAPELAEAARERSLDIADKVGHRAPELAEAARERSLDIADKISHRAPELADAARERSVELADKISERAPEFADQARGLLATAEAKADEGRRRFRKARS